MAQLKYNQWKSMADATDKGDYVTYFQGANALAHADVTGQTASNSSIVTLTVQNDTLYHTYEIGSYLTINSISVATVVIQVSYTDENSASVTKTILPTGTTVASAATGNYSIPTISIRAKYNTSITIKATFSGTSVNYDAGGFIRYIS